MFNINDIFAAIGILGFVEGIRAPFEGVWKVIVGWPVIGDILKFFENVFGSGATIL